MDDHERHVREIFTEMVALPPSEWQGFLDRRCSDQRVRARVQILLDHHITSGEFLSQPATEAFPGVAGSIGEQVAEFQIVRELGRGGMGVVYLAKDTVLERLVALKVLNPGQVDSGAALGRLRTEAKHTASLHHQGIVPVYQFGFDGDRAFIVSEFVDGPTLRTVIDEAAELHKDRSHSQDKRAWRRRCAETAASIAEALAHAHRAGVVHLDVKPSNVLMDPAAGPRLTDFGIARPLSQGVRQEPGHVAGTFHYMSPEQATAAAIPIDERSDVFSLGIVLYEMLCFQRPFEGDTPEKLLDEVRRATPMRVRSVDPTIPIDLATICHTALMRDPKERYQSAAHMAADLRSFLAGRPVMARPPGLLRRFSRWFKDHPVASLAACCLGLSAAALSFFISARAAHQDSLAWFRVGLETTGFRVFLQPIDLNGIAPQQHVALGSTPLGPQSVAPGIYRVTVVSPDGESFCEFDLRLFTPGRRNSLSLAIDQPESGPAVAVARLLPTASVAAGMIRIAPGAYAFGWSPHEQQWASFKRQVTLDAFLIDVHEVSNAEYRAFVEATGHVEPTPWREFGFDETLADHPVVGVTLADAEAFARWSGKRLPTMFEWQAAARGTQGSITPPPGMPAGMDPESEPTYQDLRNASSRDGTKVYETYKSSSRAVCQGYPDASGLWHTFSNARELTASVDPTTRDVAIAGRCWLDSPAEVTLDVCRTMPMQTNSLVLGFRCAKSATDLPQKLQASPHPIHP